MSRKKIDWAALEARIGHSFADRALLMLALTHISAVTDNRRESYQRLEFLGDHVLGCIVSELLYRSFPEADEGEMSKRLADLVRKETCADVAREMDLGPAIRLGSGEIASGGRKKEAILGDVCESVIGAVFLDGGYGAALAVVERHFGPRFTKPVERLADAKTALQEWAQGRGLPTPDYIAVSRKGPDHRPEFMVRVVLPGLEPCTGIGGSKRAAEQAAAAAMLSAEGVWQVNGESP